MHPLTKLFITAVLFTSCHTPNHVCSKGHFLQVYKSKNNQGQLNTKTAYLPFRFKAIKEYHENGRLKSKGKKRTYGAGYACIVCFSNKCGKWKYWDESGKLIRIEKYRRREQIKKTRNF